MTVVDSSKFLLVVEENSIIAFGVEMHFRGFDHTLFFDQHFPCWLPGKIKELSEVT